jgi:Uma2 family endonuclease
MGTAASPLKLTYEDYLGFPDDGRRHEILDGEHVVTPAPAPRHQFVLSNLFRLLAGFVHDRRLGRVLTAPLDVVLSEVDVVQPDLVFLSDKALTQVTETNVAGAPGLTVEVLSETSRRRDEVTKRHLYELHGVSEYWIVDPELETVKIYRRADGGFGPAVVLDAEAGHVLTSPLFPGLELRVADLFE